MYTPRFSPPKRVSFFGRKEHLSLGLLLLRRAVPCRVIAGADRATQGPSAVPTRRTGDFGANPVPVEVGSPRPICGLGTRCMVRRGHSGQRLYTAGLQRVQSSSAAGEARRTGRRPPSPARRSTRIRSRMAVSTSDVPFAFAGARPIRSTQEIAGPARTPLGHRGGGGGAG